MLDSFFNILDLYNLIFGFYFYYFYLCSSYVFFHFLIILCSIGRSSLRSKKPLDVKKIWNRKNDYSLVCRKYLLKIQDKCLILKSDQGFNFLSVEKIPVRWYLKFDSGFFRETDNHIFPFSWIMQKEEVLRKVIVKKQSWFAVMIRSNLFAIILNILFIGMFLCINLAVIEFQMKIQLNRIYPISSKNWLEQHFKTG